MPTGSGLSIPLRALAGPSARVRGPVLLPNRGPRPLCKSRQARRVYRRPIRRLHIEHRREPELSGHRRIRWSSESFRRLWAELKVEYIAGVPQARIILHSRLSLSDDTGGDMVDSPAPTPHSRHPRRVDLLVSTAASNVDGSGLAGDAIGTARWGKNPVWCVLGSRLRSDGCMRAVSPQDRKARARAAAMLHVPTRKTGKPGSCPW